MEIQYVTGDATCPVDSGNKIIAHICNDIGAWGAGFVLALSKRWPQPEEEYLKEKWLNGLSLGTVGLVQVERDIWVANMVAQRDIRSYRGVPPIRYGALKKCLATVALHAKELQASVHLPRIGCGLAGGEWEIIESLIQETFADVPIFVYDLPR